MQKRILYVAVIVSMLLAACAPVAKPPSDPIGSNDLPVGSGFSMTNDDPTPQPLTAEEIENFEAVPAPGPVYPSLEIIAIDGDAQVFIQQFMSFYPDMIQSQAIHTPHLASPAEADDRGPDDCGPIAKEIVRHVTSPFEHDIEPNIKWGGSVFALLERLFEDWSKGNKTSVEALAQSPDGRTLAMWFQWYDPVKDRTRQIMLVIGEGAYKYLGTIYPMGEAAVVAKYGPMKPYIVNIFRGIVDYNLETGKASEDARLLFSDAGIAVITLAALGMAPMLIHGEWVQFIKDYSKYWGKCFSNALKEDKGYQKWKESQKPNKYSLYSDTGVLYMTAQEAQDAGKAALGLTLVLVIVKVAVAGGTGQGWVVLIPTP